MTATRHQRRRALFFAAALLAALLAVLAPQTALADDPPPVTVPTPTVPAPTPDTAPKRAPAPTPRYRPPATRSYSPPQHTPAQPIAPQPATTTVGRPVAATPAKTPKTHPIVPIRQQSAPTHARAKFRPAGSDRAPAPIRQRVVRSGNQSSALAWILPLVLALAVGTALVIARRSHRARTNLWRLLAHGVPPHVLLRRLAQSLEGARERVAKVLPDVSAANAQKLIPQGALGRVDARLHHRALTEFVAAPVPLPAVASLEPVARLEALPEPEAVPLILSIPPSPEAEEAAPAPPTEELCEITVWRGYTRSRFYARLDVAARLDEEGCAVAESTPFRFTGNGTLEQSEAAEAAHRTLIEELVAHGWELCDSGGPWYAARFSRALVA